MENNWALSVDQCQLQAWQFSVRLIDLLSILLRCNDFTGIWKAVLDQTGSRPPNSYDDIFFGASLAWGSTLELLLGPVTELVITSCLRNHHTSHFLLHITILIEKWFIVVA